MNSSIYLDTSIAKDVLSKMFNDVSSYNIRNPYFKFICDEKKIDIKFSMKVKKYDAWLFRVNRNTITDYFLFVAFNNRLNHDLMHIWFIPGNEINHLRNLSISESRLDKWNKYEIKKED